MNSGAGSKLGNYELLALRSDGFIDAVRESDKMRVLLRKVEGVDVDDAYAKLQFGADCKRATDWRGPAALSLFDAFKVEGAFVFAFPYFAGRRASIQLLRGRRFSIEEAMRVAVAVAKLLAATEVSHGALVPASVLIDEAGDVRLLPVLHIEAGASAGKPTISAEIRQLALLIGHLVFGEAQASPNAEPRALTHWILKPEVPRCYRTILNAMLGPAGPHYLKWSDCVRDLECALKGSKSRAMETKGRGTNALVSATTLVMLAVASTWAWWSFTKAKPSNSEIPAEVAYEPVAAEAESKAEATLESSPLPETAPEPMAEASPTVALTESEALIDYIRVIGQALALSETRDFSGAVTRLEAWSISNPQHPHHEAAVRQIERIRLALAAFDAVSANGIGARGAVIVLPDQTRGTLSKVEDGQVTVTIRAQFGMVEKTAEISTLSPVSVASMLERIDGKLGSIHAPAFLLGASHFKEARGLISVGRKEHLLLSNWADDWENLVRNRDALAGMEKVVALVETGDVSGAKTELERVTTQYRDTAIVKVAMKEDVARLQQRLAALTRPDSGMMAKGSEAGYPGLPTLTLSPAVPIGDPDFQQVIHAVQWVVQNGGWERHRDSLDQALAAAAKLGAWNQHPKNLERILAQRAPALMLAQSTILHQLQPTVLEQLIKDRYNQEFLSWLFTNPRAMQMLAATLKPQDKPDKVIEIWRECWADDKQSAETYMALALAVAVVFDEDVKIIPEFFGYDTNYSMSDTERPSYEIAGLERYRFYRDCAKRGALRVPMAEMQPHELVWVVDAPVPNSELEWAQKYVNLSRRSWSRAYGMIRYRMDKAAGGRQIYERYSLAQIKEEGGICGDQAYFAAQSAKANGIPAMVIGGEGERGGHAWFGYKASRNEWNLEAGRYTSDNYAAGTSVDPQTRRSIKEHELHQLAAPERRTEAWATTERFLQLSDLLARAKRTEHATIALNLALRTTPTHVGAWNRKLDNLVASKVTSDEWQREIARMRAVFKKYPDLIKAIDDRSTAYLAQNGDVKLALNGAQRATDRLLRRNESRTDLILQSIYKELELAEKAGDPELPGRIFREALKSKGGEAVAFKQLAPRYYKWAKQKDQGRDALRDIERVFDRNFSPSGDYFALGAYRDMLVMVTNLFKQEGLEVDVRRLERKAAKIEDLRKKIGERSKRAERG